MVRHGFLVCVSTSEERFLQHLHAIAVISSKSYKKCGRRNIEQMFFADRIYLLLIFSLQMGCTDTDSVFVPLFNLIEDLADNIPCADLSGMTEVVGVLLSEGIDLFVVLLRM